MDFLWTALHGLSVGVAVWLLPQGRVSGPSLLGFTLGRYEPQSLAGDSSPLYRDNATYPKDSRIFTPYPF